MLNFLLMEIVYLGHSSFRIKGKKTIVVTDPFGENVGFKMPRVSADIITVSHLNRCLHLINGNMPERQIAD